MTGSKRICSNVCLLSLLIIKHASSFTVHGQSARTPFVLSASSSEQSRTDLDSITRRLLLNAILFVPLPLYAKCQDIESCREIGEKKVEQDQIDNPVTKLDSGARYKVLQPGTGEQTVGKDSNLDLIFSVSTMSGGYMYSRGFGYEKVDIGNGKMVKDAGLDSVRVKIGAKDVPTGIEDALIGMKKGERRRVELPPRIGLSTSNGQPEPTTRRGKAGLQGYQRMVEGTPGNPAFPVALIWDVEVLKIR